MQPALRIAVAATAAFVAVAVLVAARVGPVLAFDQGVSQRADEFAGVHQGWVAVLRFWTVAAGPLAWRLVLLVVAVVLLARRKARVAAFVLAAGVAGSVLPNLIKVVMDRPRPLLTDPYATAVGTSFPSSHATMAAAGCGTLLMLAPPRVRRLAWAPAVLVALSVGYTRVGLDVHWASDVLAGWLLGIAVVAGVHVALPGRPGRSDLSRPPTAGGG